jgi:glyoxylase-like metal-dependent hydrolase (beta-lactamase superfamily II)
MLKVQKWTFNPFQENTYLIWNDMNEAVMVDPGCYTQEEFQIVYQFIGDNQLTVLAIINTHCHLDHIFGNLKLKERYQCKLYVPQNELNNLKNNVSQASIFGITCDPSPLPDEFLKEGILFFSKNLALQILETPGHSPGGICLLSTDKEFLLSQDVLFYDSIGRTDLPGGNYNTLMSSIFSKILVLPDHVLLYPGHGPSTTVGRERKNNHFILNYKP